MIFIGQVLRKQGHKATLIGTIANPLGQGITDGNIVKGLSLGSRNVLVAYL